MKPGDLYPVKGAVCRYCDFGIPNEYAQKYNAEIDSLRKRLELAEAVLYLQDGGKIDEYERAREAWRQAKGGGDELIR